MGLPGRALHDDSREVDAASAELVADHYASDYPAIGEGPPSKWDEAMFDAGVATDAAYHAGACP